MSQKEAHSNDGSNKLELFCQEMISLNYKNYKTRTQALYTSKAGTFLTTELQSFFYIYSVSRSYKPKEINKIVTLPFPLFLEHVNALKPTANLKDPDPQTGKVHLHNVIKCPSTPFGSKMGKVLGAQ